MDRNQSIIIAYIVSMLLSTVVPGFFSTYVHVATPPNIEIGLMALLTTIFLGYLNYQQAHDRLFKDLFREFNVRYDAFNDDYQYFKKTYLEDVKMNDIKANDIKKIIDYLNLCTEEHFWFEKGRIEQTAWKVGNPACTPGRNYLLCGSYF